MKPLFDAILEYVPVRDDDPNGPLQLQISSLDYSSYVGKIGIGRITRGRVAACRMCVVMNGPEAQAPTKARINQVLTFKGLDRVLVDEAIAGDIVLINGIDDIGIGSHVCAPVSAPDALPMLKVDEPTLTMNFHGQHFAAGRTRRQVRDQPPAARAAGARAQVQRGDARARDRRRYRSLKCPAAANCT